LARGRNCETGRLVEQFIEDLAKGLGSWAYLLVGGLAMAETAAFLGFVAPGEFAVILGGVLAGEGELSIELLIGIVWACAVAGDSIGFLLGRRFGRDFMVRHGHRVRLTEERVKRVEDFFARHGGKTILIGRWFGFVRPLMPFTAGTSGMAYRRFLPYDVLSAGVWTATFALLGYIFWHSFTTITSIASRGAIVFGTLVVLAFVTYHAIKHLRTPEQRRHFAAWVDRQAQKPALRPLAAVGRAVWKVLLRPLWRYVLRPAWLVIAPPIRFAIARLTPGELGIEFTTLLAVAAVSVYTIVLQINLVETGDPLITGDRWAWELAGDIESDPLMAIAETLSFLGSFPVVLVAILTTAGYLLLKRRVPEAITLAVSFVLIEIGYHVVKAAVDRARPPDPLVDSSGSAYPSGHAALAVTYLAIAVALARAGTIPRRIGILLAGLAIGVLIGLSRVYLRVHWLSDVSGGWALGLAVFSICGCIALFVQYVRQNVSGAPAPDRRAEPEWTR
jgi:membrane protein DedA with SNARE-associated domain/membrane-associated phospholipid phosphatase